MAATAAAGHVPGSGFGAFIVVVIAVSFVVHMVRGLRAHTAEDDDAADTEATTRKPAQPATAPTARESARVRAARRGRQAFRRSRAHGWFRRLLPGTHGEPTPAAVAADGAAALLAVFAYAQGFAAGLAHAKTPPTQAPPTASAPAGNATPTTPGNPTPTDSPKRKANRTKTRLINLIGRLRRQPPEGEVVDPEPASAITVGNARNTDIVDAEIIADTGDQPVTPDHARIPEPRTQGDPPMAFIQTITDLFKWTGGAIADAETQASDAEMRAKVAASRADDAAAVAQSAGEHAATLEQLYDFWSTQNMDGASLQSISGALENARVVQRAENHRAECEAETARANYRSLAAIHAYQESLSAMASTVKARQMQHAEAQRDTGNAAAHATVLEGV